MKKIFYILISSFISLMPMIANAQAVMPYNNYGLVDVYYANSLVVDVIEWILSFTGGLAVLMIVISGIMYMTSGGDDKRVETAKKMLIYAIVGLVVILLAYVIMAAVSNTLRAK